MRRLIFVVLVALIGWLPTAAQAQSGAQTTPPPVAESYDFGLHPVMAVVAGAVSGVILATAVASTLVAGSLLADGVPLVESLEAGTGLRIPVIGASAVLGAFAGYFLFSR
jgi:hypothetical protein